ncbi:hypothetical protein BJ546DRAFT_1036801, partial [Cryomyces antarcticus]
VDFSSLLTSNTTTSTRIATPDIQLATSPERRSGDLIFTKQITPDTTYGLLFCRNIRHLKPRLLFPCGPSVALWTFQDRRELCFTPVATGAWSALKADGKAIREILIGR